MSTEMHVLFAGKLPSAAALTRAMKELGFPLAIDRGIRSLEQQDGFMPMKLRREEAGVEFDVFEGRATVEELARRDVDPKFARSANFRWGGSEDEMLCGLCAAAALAKLVDGVVLEEHEDLLLTPDEAVAFARKHLESVKPQPAGRGTRPADIKRYLKPLLQLRRDLVLVGRLLVIRPVRHLLRGAFLDRTSDRYRFRVWRYIQPLYDGSQRFDYGDHIHDAAWHVWQPHFESLLIDCLAEDIFDNLGPITTLQEFANAIISGQHAPALKSWDYVLAPMTALVLAGKQDRAADYVQRIEGETSSESSKLGIRTCWESATRDIAATCAKLHAQEAATIKALKLERIWEPSPFPVELPATERASRSADPVFVTTPWISPPAWLWQEVPSEPGQVRFAKDFLRRDGALVLPGALTRDEAEQRHRDLENYVLVARLPDGLVLMIRRFGWDRNDPDTLNYSPTWTPRVGYYLIELHGSTSYADVSAWPDKENFNSLSLHSLRVNERVSHENLWQCSIDFEEGVKGIHDSRTGKTIYGTSPLSSAERALATCPMPAFGEYAIMAGRLRELLLILGYGKITLRP
jgi:hypothetical protein